MKLYAPFEKTFSRGDGCYYYKNQIETQRDREVLNAQPPNELYGKPFFEKDIYFRQAHEIGGELLFKADYDKL